MTLHIERRHAIVVPLPLDNAFPLFTPAGERLWLAEWQPEFLHPADGRTETGMVFRTGHGGEETLWSCIEFTPEEHRIRYVRVSPATRFVTLTIQCYAESPPAGTRAEITYAMTALTPEGSHMLEAITPQDFANSLDQWAEKIARFTANLPAGAPALDKYGYVSAGTPCNGGAASVSPGA